MRATLQITNTINFKIQTKHTAFVMLPQHFSKLTVLISEAKLELFSYEKAIRFRKDYAASVL